MNTKYLLIGIVLQIMAVLIALFSERVLYAIGWLATLVFAVPLFLASIYFLMSSGAPILLRLALSFWILAIPAYFIAILVFETNRARTEVVLVPLDFRGNATIIFGQADGSPPEEDGRKILLRLEPEGQLRTQVPGLVFANREVGDAVFDRREFYWIDSAGKRTRMDAPRSTPGEDDIAADRVIVWDIITVSPEKVNGQKVAFIVGTIGELNKFRASRRY